MQKRILPAVLTAIIMSSLFILSCTKLDTTDIGSDLLPAVDNINTFDTILDINSTQGIFNDSEYISKTEDYAVGAINNDLLFGKTQANIYMQLKPPFYPYYFGNAGDTLVELDSVILCLKYKGFWGDSTKPIRLDVREVVDNQFRDSVYVENKTAYKPTVGTLLGSSDIDVRTLANYIKFTNGRDSVNNQIRIPITVAAWKNMLFAQDSVESHTGTNAFYSDSAFRRIYNGIAVIANSTSSNGLIYCNISDTSTKIEIHYKKKNHGIIDSTYSSFRLTSSILPGDYTSNTSNYILRSRSGFPVSSPAPTEHYLQTAPGTYVNLSIPGLSTLSNRIIHRAEIIVEQMPADPVMDKIFSAPNFLYLDLKDTTADARWKPVYFDLNQSVNYDPDYKTTVYYFLPTDSYGFSNIDFHYFGGFARTKTDPLTGNEIKYYNFNVSRYVQHIVTNHFPNYGMRLYAPLNLYYPQYSTDYIPYNNNIAFGRVRIGSGSNPNYKLRMRIVYSKIN